MPYNNAPISPPEEITGTSALPLARVKKIIAMDDEIAQCSNNAAFAISIATEVFIRYLTEQAHKVAKSERKPRRTIAYKDVATAVARIDNLEFLSDVVPKTKTYRQVREQQAQDEAAAAAKANGILTTNGVNGDSSSRSIQSMMQPSSSRPGTSNGIYDPTERNLHSSSRGSGVPDRTLNSTSTSNHPDPVRDIEMSG